LKSNEKFRYNFAAAVWGYIRPLSFTIPIHILNAILLLGYTVLICENLLLPDKKNVWLFAVIISTYSLIKLILCLYHFVYTQLLKNGLILSRDKTLSSELIKWFIPLFIGIEGGKYIKVSPEAYELFKILNWCAIGFVAIPLLFQKEHRKRRLVKLHGIEDKHILKENIFLDRAVRLSNRNQNLIYCEIMFALCCSLIGAGVHPNLPFLWGVVLACFQTSETTRFNLLMHPTILFLGASANLSNENRKGLAKSLFPLRIVSFLSPEIFPEDHIELADLGIFHPNWDNLRVLNEQKWQEIVNLFMDLAPIVIVETRIVTDDVLKEIEWLLESPARRRYKGCFIVDDNNNSPALEAISGLQKDTLRCIREEELISWVKTVTRSKDTLPKPENKKFHI
jgi:hypothetical protein